MTAYSETTRVAHVMRWLGPAKWLSWCHSVTREGPLVDQNGIPVLRFTESNDQPTKPWCGKCTAAIAKTVANWQADNVVVLVSFADGTVGVRGGA